ncbi:Choline/ethanolaminephosphotransferase [Sistotremastrum suecicum HHB10207 ss-3]|uniref:diacylglycerol cholinephosphotransferase n=1 Tax=Sistotremastrum suecicum HHB10207 ss-3 TaxID=1314776 RepID=A0A166HDK4_9AGAM|nr:Choline/ethanolaminephosphotransferase [Sistotremastrum suecicum HHB10207 ss-3]
MRYLPQEALNGLSKYSYKSVDKSLLSNYVLNPYWNQLVKLWPLWVAPNTITLSGLALVFLNFLTLLAYDPSYLCERGGVVLPSWVYYSWAIGLFLYQSFDAIDGKQARRTGMAGPLGEMFDHGCDAINTTLEVLLAGQALNLGRSWWVVASLIASLAAFYLTTWEEYYTGQLFLGVISGPVEGILLITSIFVVSGIYGPSIWDTPILRVLHLENVGFLSNSVLNLGINEVFLVLCGFGLAFNVVTSCANVTRSIKQKRTTATRPPLLNLLPFVVTMGLHVVWLSAPTPTKSFIVPSPLLLPFLASWGLQFAHQVGRMILAHVTGQGFPWWDSTWIWLSLASLDVYTPVLFGRSSLVQSSVTGVQLVVYSTLVLSFILYARFVYLVIWDITEHMGIACFTVRKKDSQGHWNAAVDAKGKKIL